MGEFSIGSHLVGGANRCFVIAKIGVNHDGQVDKALRLFDAAAEAGADAAKLQTFDRTRLTIAAAPLAKYQRHAGEWTNQAEMLGRLMLPADAYPKVIEAPRENQANAIFEYLEIFHNRQPRHSALGMRTPIEFEQRQIRTVA